MYQAKYDCSATDSIKGTIIPVRVIRSIPADSAAEARAKARRMLKVREAYGELVQLINVNTGKELRV